MGKHYAVLGSLVATGIVYHKIWENVRGLTKQIVKIV